MYDKSGNIWTPYRDAALNFHDALPGDNYVVVKSAMSQQLQLERVDPFTIPARIYGDVARHAQRILRTFNERPQSTGVLLVGEKGSGKTLLSKHICDQLRQVGVPTLVINQPWRGDQFNAFIQSIEQPCVVLFDEFEKVYKPEEQEALLTLLDGVFGSRKLFLLTCNSVYRVDTHLQNRPGRIYYYIEFSGLREEFIAEYCRENLHAQEHLPRLLQISQLYSQFSFDMLQCVVEEMNRYGESPAVALELLNARPERGTDGHRYAVQVIYKGQVYTGEALDYPRIYVGNPLNSRSDVDVEFRERVTPDEVTGSGERHNFAFEADDIVSIDKTSTIYTFQKDDAQCVLTRLPPVMRFNPLTV